MAKAARNRGAVRTGGRQVPGWVWLFTGVVTGLFIAFLVHLAQLQREQPPAERPPMPADNDADAGESDDGEKKGPRFDFYAVLPKMEVIVPKGDDKDAGKETEGQGDTGEPDLSHRHDEHFLLQAGSFGKRKDADRRRAELILQGYEVHIQQVELEGGESWHRVMVGPFNNANALHRAQDELAAVGIDTLPIRRKQDE